ncbi:LysR family transcriptional regulator [Pollutimonas bauzanensis]|uniref:LysR family transcriptional regulator, nitrogen assimilation regulatory protein n=1 Tax=Pollutimonas bauzanensis TaxID=658167 RepID=A0A1M5ZTI9_9BURK|nr:LysR family transcriptional regulator [Pollutimonas bauzanensis]SHI27551.1 LysR family transcriptional regulator, nitrogen assimilation regulatory protein [Pollutimonas bauzanensis]
MNLRQLSYFIAVAEQRSIIKAAQLLHISQPAISTQIKLLEEELEVQLFERRQEGTILTPEGKDFHSYARVALDTLDAAKASLRSRQVTEVGTVTVGIPGSLSPLLTLSLIEQVRERCPNIKIKVVTGLSGHLAKWIMDGTIDFGLVYSSSPVIGLDFELLMKEQLFLAVHSKNAGPIEDMCVNGDISCASLRHVPLVMPSREHGLRALVEKVAASVGVKLNVRTELDAHELLLECVLRTTDATILSLAALKNIRIPQEEIFTAHITDPVIERRVCLAYATDRPLTRTARRVEVILRELLKTESGAGWWRFATIND